MFGLVMELTLVLVLLLLFVSVCVEMSWECSNVIVIVWLSFCLLSLVGVLSF